MISLVVDMTRIARERVRSVVFLLICYAVFVQVRDASRAGDLAAAQQASNSARCLNLAGIITGVALIAVSIISVVVVVAVVGPCDDTDRDPNNDCT